MTQLKVTKKKNNIKDLLETALQVQGGDTENKRNYIPVPPREFLTSEYYSGFQKDDIYDFWVDEVCDFVENEFSEWIVTGSLGSGKSTGANLLLEYMLYELFSWKSLNKYLMIPELQEVYNIYFSISQTQAKRTGFSQFKSMTDSSRWYKENAQRDKKIDSILKWNNGKFGVFSGSNHSHAIGMTILFFILDEADFFKRGSTGFDESYDTVTEMYEELVDRRISRFRKFGKDFSFSVLISSASYTSSFTEKRIQAAADDPRIKVTNAVGYDIKPKGTYSEETFIVFKGHEMVDPEIIEENTQFTTILDKLKYEHKVNDKLGLGQNLKLLPPEVKIQFLQVPIDFRKQFDTNVHRSLMNHSGVFTARIGKLFQSKTLLTNAYKDHLEHPFTKTAIELSTGDQTQLKDYFLPHLLTDIHKPHGIHVDMSVSGDHTGFSMIRYDGMKRDEKGAVSRKYTQVFSLEIVPPSPPYRIKLSKIRDFIIYMKRKLDINIEVVSYDQYQSEDSIQILIENGINAVRQSIDKDDSAYIAWMSLLLDENIDMYRHELLEKESFEAVHDRRKRKVDHPKHGTIDVLQSFVGGLHNLVKSEWDVDESDELPLPDNRKEDPKDEIKKMQSKGRYSNNIAKDIVSGKKKKEAFDAIFDD